MGSSGFFVIFGRKALENAHVAQLAEHVLGKDEVTSSILVMGSSFENETLSENNKIEE